MEIQLTKTKTITIGGGQHRRKTDIVGVDLFSGDERGCPAVRLTEKKGVLTVAAAGFVPPPANPLPDSWDAAAKSCSWSLPSEFQAPQAALAVTSPEMFYAQTTPEAFKSDLAAGAHRSAEPAKAKSAKIGIIRKPSAPKPEPAPAPAPAAAKAAPEAAPGEPVSNGGVRFVMKPMAKMEGFVMEAGLPEYQVLWLSRLLPEGRRPTAASIQLKPAALAASVLKLEEFASAKGSALALFPGESEMAIAGYKEGDLVLWRKCRCVPGWREIREGVKRGLGLEDDMVESVLDDTLIDPLPVLEPLLKPLIEELAISRDYLVSKLGVTPESVLAIGLPAGAKYFSALAEEQAHLKVIAPPVFGGLHLAAEVKTPAAFLGALGAALAVLGEEAAK